MGHMIYSRAKTQILMFPHIKFISISITALIVAVMVVAPPLCFYQNVSATSAIGPLGVQYSIYNVIIQGQALDIPFQREGMLLITQVPIGTAGTQMEKIHLRYFLHQAIPEQLLNRGQFGL
jgi:hypothetical protein